MIFPHVVIEPPPSHHLLWLDRILFLLEVFENYKIPVIIPNAHTNVRANGQTELEKFPKQEKCTSTCCIGWQHECSIYSIKWHSQLPSAINIIIMSVLTLNKHNRFIASIYDKLMASLSRLSTGTKWQFGWKIHKTSAAFDFRDIFSPQNFMFDECVETPEVFCFTQLNYVRESVWAEPPEILRVRYDTLKLIWNISTKNYFCS